jgi:hypothetical protein
MTQQEEQQQLPNWAVFLGSPESFACTVGPFLSNRELFQLSAASRAVLSLCYALGRWAVQLDGDTYESFRIKRHSVPPCFQGMASFDQVAYLGSRLKVRIWKGRNMNVDALAGVQTLDLSACDGIRDVGTLGGVHSLNLTRCYGIRDVSALGGVRTLNLGYCTSIRDVSSLGGVHTLTLSGCRGITDMRALGGEHTLFLTYCSRITDVSALGGVHTLGLSACSRITNVSALGSTR